MKFRVPSKAGNLLAEQLLASQELLYTMELVIGSEIAQWYSAGVRAKRSGGRVTVGTGNFSLHHRVQTGSGAHPASYPMGTRNSFLRVKRPGRETDHSPPSSAEVKNG
jgi:hypothetical protein